MGIAFAAILIGGISGGCSLSRSDAFAQMDTQDLTGSIAALAPSISEKPSDADLAFARNAASDVLTKGDKDSSQPWDNPASGARGSVTPLAAAYSSDGRTCREFLASYVKGKTESWLQGTGCRSSEGRWEIQSLKPWRRT